MKRRTRAEDAVQETWLRLSRSADPAITHLAGWLTTVVGRVCIDLLRARQARHETYVGTWLPEPVVTADDAESPDEQAILADYVGMADARRPGDAQPSRAAGVRAP